MIRICLLNLFMVLELLVAWMAEDWS